MYLYFTAKAPKKQAPFFARKGAPCADSPLSRKGRQLSHIPKCQDSEDGGEEGEDPVAEGTAAAARFVPRPKNEGAPAVQDAVINGSTDRAGDIQKADQNGEDKEKGLEHHQMPKGDRQQKKDDGGDEIHKIETVKDAKGFFLVEGAVKPIVNSAPSAFPNMVFAPPGKAQIRTDAAPKIRVHSETANGNQDDK